MASKQQQPFQAPPLTAEQPVEDEDIDATSSDLSEDIPDLSQDDSSSSGSEKDEGVRPSRKLGAAALQPHPKYAHGRGTILQPQLEIPRVHKTSKRNSTPFRAHAAITTIVHEVTAAMRPITTATITKDSGTAIDGDAATSEQQQGKKCLRVEKSVVDSLRHISQTLVEISTKCACDEATRQKHTTLTIADLKAVLTQKLPYELWDEILACIDTACTVYSDSVTAGLEVKSAALAKGAATIADSGDNNGGDADDSKEVKKSMSRHKRAGLKLPVSAVEQLVRNNLMGKHHLKNLFAVGLAAFIEWILRSLITDMAEQCLSGRRVTLSGNDLNSILRTDTVIQALLPSTHCFVPGDRQALVQRVELPPIRKRKKRVNTNNPPHPPTTPRTPTSSSGKRRQGKITQVSAAGPPRRRGISSSSRGQRAKLSASQHMASNGWDRRRQEYYDASNSSVSASEESSSDNLAHYSSTSRFDSSPPVYYTSSSEEAEAKSYHGPRRRYHTSASNKPDVNFRKRKNNTDYRSRKRVRH